MKRILSLLLAVCLAGCAATVGGSTDKPDDGRTITVSSPTPTKALTKVSLTETEQGYMKAGNRMAFKFLSQLWGLGPDDIVCSPLSLQYALAMAVNGAKGATADEILQTLGYGTDGIPALNAYCHKLLNELPAVDLEVVLRLADAMVVNEQFRVQASFKEVLENQYYAAMVNMPFTDVAAVLGLVNGWASDNTNGLIKNLLQDLSPDAAAILLNALYFKAKWTDEFEDYATQDQPFSLLDGTTKKVKMMNARRILRYVQKSGWRAVSIPYGNGRFAMQILLPDAADGIPALIQALQTTDWGETALAMTEADVILGLPRFTIESRFELIPVLRAMGMETCFKPFFADFSLLFDEPEESFYISQVIQQAKIIVDEAGTEAAAVTAIVFDKATSVGPGPETPVKFIADHPFVFLITERTSGAILFEGVCTGAGL